MEKQWIELWTKFYKKKAELAEINVDLVNLKKSMRASGLSTPQT
jgi:hypothetical protein